LIYANIFALLPPKHINITILIFRSRHGHPVTWLLGHPVTRLPGILTNWAPGYLVSWLPDILVTKNSPLSATLSLRHSPWRHRDYNAQ